MAGIWETQNNLETEDKLVSSTILTTEVRGVIADIHHRMPLIILSEYYDLWLGKLDGRTKLIKALPNSELKLYPVSKTVSIAKNDSS